MTDTVTLNPTRSERVRAAAPQLIWHARKALEVIERAILRGTYAKDKDAAEILQRRDALRELLAGLEG